jgi:hypothetical protein
LMPLHQNHTHHDDMSQPELTFVWRDQVDLSDSGHFTNLKAK